MKCEWITEIVLGSDCLFYLDGRLGKERLIEEARKVKEKFNDGFKYKYDYMIKFECKKGIFYV